MICELPFLTWYSVTTKGPVLQLSKLNEMSSFIYTTGSQLYLPGIAQIIFSHYTLADLNSFNLPSLPVHSL
jgi:hypothetical protein